MGGVSGMDYWHKRYTCPYFTSSEKRRVCCEGEAASASRRAARHPAS